MPPPAPISWLSSVLAELSPQASTRNSLEHAGRILWAVRQIQRAGEIRVKKGISRRVRPRKKISPKDELNRLRAAAKRAIVDETKKAAWSEVWSETAEEPDAVTSKRVLGFCNENYRRTQILPFPEDALVLIKDAIDRLQCTTGTQRRARVVNDLDADLSNAIVCAFICMTAPSEGRKKSYLIRLQALALRIDEHFDLRIYKPDGRKVRALRAIYKSSAR